ncbi:MAG: TIR-like protein FxsC [Trebonia sp.]|jgi:FxsC-like protein
MTEAHDVPTPYFFLSYARSDPLAGSSETDPDELVERFFADLTNAVRRHASGGNEAVSGFFDRGIPVGSDWKHFITRAMSAAQVFVPLYSVGYLTNSWPGRELAYFRKRVMEAARGNPVRRVVPVLWAPLAGFHDPPGLRESLSAGVTDADYADNGLRALLKLRYDDAYLAVVNRLAAQIVELAERDPIEPVEPSRIGDIESLASEFAVGARPPIFMIEVAAPTVASAPQSHGPRAYGETPAQWRPFPGQELPLAEYARQIADRLDFQGRVGAVGQGADNAARRPGIIVIDPAFIGDGAGRATLRAVANGLPPWVLPVVVVAPDDQPGNKLAEVVFDTLASAAALPTETARRAAGGVNSLDQFVSIVPRLVSDAERQYLRYRSSRVVLSRPSGRPRLGWSDGPAA